MFDPLSFWEHHQLWKSPMQRSDHLKPWAVLHWEAEWQEPEEELPTSPRIWLLVPCIKPTSKNHYEVFAERASVEKHVSKQNNSLCHFFQLAYHLEILIFFQRVGKKCASGTNKCLQLSYKPRMVGLKTGRLAVMELKAAGDKSCLGIWPACATHRPLGRGSLASHWSHPVRDKRETPGTCVNSWKVKEGRWSGVIVCLAILKAAFPLGHPCISLEVAGWGDVLNEPTKGSGGDFNDDKDS